MNNIQLGDDRQILIDFDNSISKSANLNMIECFQFALIECSDYQSTRPRVMISLRRSSETTFNTPNELYILIM
ncbi:hypothetical protein QVD17_06541 [Tagetes erecta]|uniref:Uncharacterized protein n=1 Tax=Tagetes erecta TaxID=13708 RepID=A0AAD8LNL4_TARER|nr:hypothetical protein QVD17_06541 [Tagetes erecta]